MSTTTSDLFANAEEFIVDPTKNYLEELVGEGKPYATDKDLARAVAEKEAMIKRLKNETGGLRTELDTRINYEEFLNKISTLPQLSNADTQHQQEPPPDNTAMSPEALDRLLDDKLRKLDSDRRSEQNRNIVLSRLQEVYGPNYASNLKKQISDIGLDEDLVNTLASTNPKALFNILRIEEQQQTRKGNIFDAPPRSTSNSSGLPFSRADVKGDTFYEKLRKEDSRTYWTPKVQNEILEQIKEMGSEAFYKS